MIRPSVRRLRALLRGPASVLPLNIPFLLLLFLYLSLGHALTASLLPRLNIVEIVWVVVLTTLHTILLALSMGLLLGEVRGRSPFAASILAGVALLISSAFLIDYLGFMWLGLHIRESLALLVYALGSGSRVTTSKLQHVGALLLLLLAILSTGAVFHHLSGRWRRATWKVRRGRLLVALAACVAGLASLQATAGGVLGDNARWAVVKTLPQLNLALPSRRPLLVIESPVLRGPPDAATVEHSLESLKAKKLKHRPNILLLVLESVRADSVEAVGAPNLTRLTSRAIPIERGFASANCTHIAWSSLFHGTLPTTWNELFKRRTGSGAYPFRVLRTLGYRTRIFAAHRLEYFGSARILLGDGLKLSDQLIDVKENPEALNADPAHLDELVVKELIAAIDRLAPDSGEFLLGFIDSAHHDYWWGAGFEPPFRPYSEHVSLYRTALDDREIALLHNRYRNSIAWIDTLVGRLLSKLAAKQLLEQSIVVITGDHGEEFLERGHLVHSSELNRFQTEVPLIIVPPERLRHELRPISVAAHVDVFATIFDMLGVAEETRAALHGHSLVGPTPPPAAVSARCSSWAPTELLLASGSNKMIIELDGFVGLDGSRRARRLSVMELRDTEDRVTHVPEAEVRDRVAPALKVLLEPGFAD